MSKPVLLKSLDKMCSFFRSGLFEVELSTDNGDAGLSITRRPAAKQMAHLSTLVPSPRTRQNPIVAAIVLLSAVSPSKLGGELEVFGHTVWEALAVSEVLFLCEQHSIDAVVIAADVEQGELIERQLRGIVMRLDSKADATYLDWELSQLFPKNQPTIQ